MGYFGQIFYVYGSMPAMCRIGTRHPFLCVFAYKRPPFSALLLLFLSTDEAKSKPGEISLSKKIVTGEQELLVRQCPGWNPR